MHSVISIEASGASAVPLVTDVPVTRDSTDDNNDMCAAGHNQALLR